MACYQINLYTYSLLFVDKNVSLGFIQLLCTHNFFRVSFAAELSTKIVYNNVFVIDYDYIYIYFYLLFFIKMKLSICSRSVILNWFGLGTPVSHGHQAATHFYMTFHLTC